MKKVIKLMAFSLCLMAESKAMDLLDGAELQQLARNPAQFAKQGVVYNVEMKDLDFLKSQVDTNPCCIAIMTYTDIEKDTGIKLYDYQMPDRSTGKLVDALRLTCSAPEPKVIYSDKITYSYTSTHTSSKKKSSGFNFGPSKKKESSIFNFDTPKKKESSIFNFDTSNKKEFSDFNFGPSKKKKSNRFKFDF